MADKKLNEVTKVTDMAYVPVIMSDGSIGQIAKADLASVVAGLIGNPLGTKEKLSNIDLNDLHTSGIYDQTGGTAVLNAPASGSAYRMFIVFKSGSFTVQIAIDNNNNEFRRIFSYGSWSDWG